MIQAQPAVSTDTIVLVWQSVSTLGLIGVAWKGAWLLSKIVTTLDTLSGEVTRLRESVDKLAGVPERLHRLENDS